MGRPVADFTVGVRHPETVPAAFAISLARAAARLQFQICESQSSVIDKSANTIVRKFLDESPYEWLCLIDADMVFTSEDLLDLRRWADVEHPIVSGVAVRPLEGARGECVASRLVDGEYQRLSSFELLKPQQVDGVGAAFMMVHRTVLEKFPEGPRRWFAFTDDRQEDYEFCHRVRQLGFPVWSVPVMVGHRKSFTLYPDREPAL